MADDLYLIPGTDVLRNRLNITDAGRLATAEDGLTAARQRQLERSTITLARSYDLDHLRAVHRHLFQDVYDWAGQLRSSTNIRKEGDDKQFVSSDLVPIRATMLFSEVKAANYLRGQPLDVFVDNCAGLLAELNELHGFRDGNGRAQREYLRELAEDAGYRLNWAGIDADANNAASRASMAGESLDHRPFIPLLRSIITPAGPTGPTHTPSAQQQQADRPRPPSTHEQGPVARGPIAGSSRRGATPPHRYDPASAPRHRPPPGQAPSGFER